MKRFLISVYLTLVLGMTAQAETVTVRSGEHVGFTRLVLYLPRPLEWKLESENSTSILSIDDEDITFDLSVAFEKISRDRVSSIEPTSTNNTLYIGVNCDCTVTSFLHDNSMLVIDISDEPNGGEIAGQADLLDIPPEGSIKEPVPFYAETAADNGRHVPNRFPYVFAQLGQEPASQYGNFHLGFGVSLAPPASTPEIEVLVDMERLDRLKRVKDAEQRLIAQIGRAATQGLLSVRQTQFDPVPISENSHQNQAIENETDVNEPNRPTNPLANVNLKAESSIDRSLMRALAALPLTRNGETCLSNEDLAIETWGVEGDFGAQLGHYRARLFGEFDQPNTEIALGLTQLYLYFGFGAEAKHSLNMVDLEPTQQLLYSSLSRIMELRHDPVPGPLHGQLECDTAAAFWSALAYVQIPQSAEINISALLRTLNTIPLHLRAHLGPILSERLVLAGEANAAASVLRVLERGMDNPDPKVRMAEATLEMAEGDLEAATASLDAVVKANTEMSPDALVHLIDTLLAQQEAISPKIADLAGAFAHERRDEPIGQDLRRVHILALADAARFSDAMQELSRFKTDKSLSGYRELRSKTIQILAEKADDLTFLEFALLQSHEAPDKIEPEVANFVANRLLNMGFGTSASKFIRDPVDGAVGRERRILRARQALSERRPRRAEAEILGLEGREIDELRAHAQSITGNHSVAQQFYTSLDQTVSADSEAWLAEDWAHLTKTNNPIVAAAARLMISEEPASAKNTESGLFAAAPPQGILAQNRDLLGASATARETLSALLDAMEVDLTIEQ